MLYAITDRRLYGWNEAERRERLLALTREWAGHGVGLILLREQDLPVREQLELARAMGAILRAHPQNRTRLLLHSRADLALAAAADGVHLSSGPGELTPDEVRALFAARKAPTVVSLSCHAPAELAHAREQRPDWILFAPVFEKILRGGNPGEDRLPGAGLDRLREAAALAAPVPVLALGGVTAANASECLAAGARGIAAIRLMMEPPAAWRALI